MDMSRRRRVERSSEKSELQRSGRKAWNKRRLARVGVAVLAVGVLTAVAIVYFIEREGGTAFGLCCPITPPTPEPGSARPWEVEIPVSTYSRVHTRHGNLLTVIPIIGWSGRGPERLPRRRLYGDLHTESVH